MTVKPLNLSILIGDMNNSPQITPRPMANQNKKSRIPLATSQTCPGSGITTFRQWADPPPPPIRSRTLERKVPHMVRKRPGSADPRFRRTLEIKSNIEQHTEPPLHSVKKESASSCELTPPYTAEVPETALVKREDKIDNLPESDNTELLKPVDSDLLPSSTSSETTQHKYLEANTLENKCNENQLTPVENCTDLSTQISDKLSISNMPRNATKESQTDLCGSDINEFIPEHYGSKDQEVINYINYDAQKYLDGIVLNRTRSISTLYELEPVNKLKQGKTRSYGSISRIILKQNVFSYFELWATIGFFIAIVIFAWYCVIPYIIDLYFTWIHPKPPLTASSYIRKSLSELARAAAELIYGLLTTPAIRRLY